MKSEQAAHSGSKRDYWKRTISEWEGSGCRTQAAFCRQAGISIKSFSRWRSVFAREAFQSQSEIGFAKVEVQARHPAGSGIRIALSPHVEKAGVSPCFAHCIRQMPCVERYRDRPGFVPARGHNDLAWQASFQGCALEPWKDVMPFQG